MTSPPGWKPARILAEVRARGSTLYQLALDHGMHRNGLASTLYARARFPRQHALIAGFIDQPLHELWPSLYGPEGYVSRRNAYAWPPETFERILARVAAGERLGRICAEPGMPRKPCVDRYRKRHPDFDARYAEAITGRNGARVTTARVANVTAAVVAAVEGGASLTRQAVAARTTINRYRRRDADFDRRIGALIASRAEASRTAYSVFDAILARAQRGESLRAICAGPGTASRDTVERFRRRHAEFDVQLVAAFGTRRRLRRPARPLNPHAAREAFVRALRQDEIYAIAQAAVPRGLPEFMAEDIRSDVVLGLLTGAIHPAGAKAAARAAIAAYNRMFGRRDISMDDSLGDGLAVAGMIADWSFDAEGTGIRAWKAGW